MTKHSQRSKDTEGEQNKPRVRDRRRMIADTTIETMKTRKKMTLLQPQRKAPKDTALYNKVIG